MGDNNLKPVLKIVLDTNFLMTPFNLGLDVISELDRIINQKYEIIILKGTIEELERLSENPSLKVRKAAKLALELAQRYTIIDSASKNGDMDKLIVNLSKKEGYIVATNDKNLRRKLKSEGIPTIYVRQKSHLQIDGDL
ncbi:MAG: PIN domain-containing protein [Candidatus Jordarchaeaceae archaeon]